MELSITTLIQLCMLGGTGIAAVVTMVDLCATGTGHAATRAAGHGRARRR